MPSRSSPALIGAARTEAKPWPRTMPAPESRAPARKGIPERLAAAQVERRVEVGEAAAQVVEVAAVEAGDAGDRDQALAAGRAAARGQRDHHGLAAQRPLGGGGELVERGAGGPGGIRRYSGAHSSTCEIPSSSAGAMKPVRIAFAINSVFVRAENFSFSFCTWKRTVDSEM